MGADCGSDHELLIVKFRLKLKKVGTTPRPFRYDLNPILSSIWFSFCHSMILKIILEKKWSPPTSYLISAGYHVKFLYLSNLLVCMLRHYSPVQLCASLWCVTFQASLPMAFSRQEYWSGLWCPFPGDLPNPGIKPMSLTFPVWAGGFFTTCQLGSPSNLFTS